MKQLHLLVVLAATAALLAAPASSFGQEEGVLARLNPFRVVRNRHAEPLSTHSPADLSAANLERRGIHSPLVDDSIARRSALQQQQQYRQRFDIGREDVSDTHVDPLRSRFAERSIDTAAIDQRAVRADQAQENGGPLGERTAAGTPPTMEELRAHLLSRGIDPTLVDQRIARMTAARENGQRVGRDGNATTQPNLNQIRAEMAHRGINSREYDEQIVRRTEARSFGEKFENRLHGNGEPNDQQIRTRLTRNGVDPTSLNTRFGRSAAATDGSLDASRYGGDRNRRR